MYGYIYKTTFLETGLYYVGQHKASKFEPHRYLGSGTIFLRILHKQQKLARSRGEKWKDVWYKYFECELLKECASQEEMDAEEIFWVNKLKARDRAFGYNITPGGFGGGCTPTEETREKLRLVNSNRVSVYNDFERRNIKFDELQDYLDNGYVRGVPPFERSEEFKEKVSQTLTGYRCIHKGTERLRVPSNELEYYLDTGYQLGWPKKEKPEKPSGQRKGMLSPDGQYKVIAESEHKKYLQAGWIFGAPKVPKEKIHYGIIPSDETRKKLSDAHKGKTPTKEAVEKQAAKLRGRVTINKDGKKKLIEPAELEKYLAEGWLKGSLTNINSRSRVVICYETGEEFISVAEAQRVHPEAGSLKRCLKTGYKAKSGGFHWYYKDDLARKNYLENL